MSQLPSGWDVAALSQVAELGSGGTPRAGHPEYYGGDIPWAVIGDLNDGFVTQTQSSITAEGLRNSSAKLLPVGTILIAMYGSIGKLGVTGMPLATNQAIACVKPRSTIYPMYLFYFLLSQRDYLAAAGKGATQRNISQTILKPWEVAHPRRISEQQRIVDVLEDHLSRVDAAIATLKSSARRLGSLKRAELQAIFGFNGADSVPLSSVVQRIEAGKSFGSSSGPAQGGEWGIIKVSAMTWGEFRGEENKRVLNSQVDRRFEVRSGDLLVSRANTSDYVGASVLVREARPQLLLSDKSLRVVPAAGVEAEWLWRALQSPSSRQQITAMATGTKESMRNISQKALLSVRVRDENQSAMRAAVQQFAAREQSVASMERCIVHMERRSAALRRAVLAAAFSGRLTGHSTDTEIIEELAG